jgi:histidine triad (HIT) family protein
VVPNRAIPTLDDVSVEDEAVLGRMMRVAADLARGEGIAEDGYRVMLNCRRHGGQEVYHIHLHLLGGRPLGPMLVR